MGKGLISKIADFREFNRKKKEFEKAVNHALTRDEYLCSGQLKNVGVPKEIREDYFELFGKLVGKNSINIGTMTSPNFLDSHSLVDFVGYSDHHNGATVNLSYLPEKVNLEVSDYKLNGEKINPGIQEIGKITTERNGLGNFVTNIRVGKNFRYNSGFSANHLISHAIDYIQDSENIPQISESRIMKLKHHPEKEAFFRSLEKSAFYGINR